MPSTHIRILALAALLFAVPATSSAFDEEEEEEDAPMHPFTRSIGISPGALFGTPAGSLEYLLGYRHGLVADGSYALLGPSAGSWAATAGYRLHFSRGLEGLFVGGFAKSAGFRSEFPFQENGKTRTYDFEGSFLSLGANLGYRWLSARGWNVVVRGGYGYPMATDFRWSPTEPEDQALVGLVETLLGLDFEATLGYAF